MISFVGLVGFGCVRRHLRRDLSEVRRKIIRLPSVPNVSTFLISGCQLVWGLNEAELVLVSGLATLARLQSGSSGTAVLAKLQDREGFSLASLRRLLAGCHSPQPVGQRVSARDWLLVKRSLSGLSHIPLQRAAHKWRLASSEQVRSARVGEKDITASHNLFSE